MGYLYVDGTLAYRAEALQAVRMFKQGTGKSLMA